MVKKKDKKRWWERRDMSHLMKDTKVKGGRYRTIKTHGRTIPMFIPDQAFEMDPIQWEQFMGLNQILSRWLVRKFPDQDANQRLMRAHAAAMAAWIDPPAAIQHLNDSLAANRVSPDDLRLVDIEIQMLRTVDDAFGHELMLEDMQTNQEVKEIILELWEDQPPSMIPESYMNLPEPQKTAAVDRVMEYTMFLHESFKHVHPMMRAEVASFCAERTAKHMLQHATDETRPMVMALANKYERS